MKSMHGFVTALITLSIIMSIPVAEASNAPQYRISIDQDGNHATLSIDPSPDYAKIYWDFDDGSFDTGQSVSHEWLPGLYNVTAVIVDDVKTTVAKRYVGIYSESPVTEIQRNAEYRYAVYIGDVVNLTVKDSDGKLVSWLEYDDKHRIVTGTPRNTGVYHATLTGTDAVIEWSILVTHGTVVDEWIRFSARGENDKVIVDNMYGSASGTLRYSWTLSDLDDFLISASEGIDPNVTAAPGVYKLAVKAQGMGVYASYSQFIILDEEPAALHDMTFDTTALITITAITAVVAALFYVSTRDPRALLGTVVSVLVTALFMVI